LSFSDSVVRRSTGRFFLKFGLLCILAEVEYGSMKYFALCSLGGLISCGSTHTALVPVDLVKCRMQVNPDKYKGMLSGLKVNYFLLNKVDCDSLCGLLC